MKICPSCEYKTQVNRILCQCGHSLVYAEKISEEELTKIIRKASDRTDPLHVNTRHKLIFYVNLFLIAASIVLAIISVIHHAFALLFVFFSLISLTYARFPGFLWGLEKLTISMWAYGDVEPSDFWRTRREILMYFWLILSIVMIILGIYDSLGQRL